jgi:hypothetical protein
LEERGENGDKSRTSQLKTNCAMILTHFYTLYLQTTSVMAAAKENGKVEGEEEGPGGTAGLGGGGFSFDFGV